MTREEFMEDIENFKDLWDIIIIADAIDEIQDITGYRIFSDWEIEEMILDSISTALNNYASVDDIISGLNMTDRESDGYFFIEDPNNYCCFRCIDDEEYIIDELKEAFVENFGEFFEESYTIEDSEYEELGIDPSDELANDRFFVEVKRRELNSKIELSNFEAPLCVDRLFN